MIKPTPCQCTDGGVCPHHLRYIGPRGVMLCQNSPKHYEAFRAGADDRLIQISGDFPSLVDQAKSLAASLVQLKEDGFQSAPKEVEDFRRSNCGQCPGNINGRCKACGCLIWVKIKFPGESCPIGIWGPVQTSDEIATTDQGCGCGQ